MSDHESDEDIAIRLLAFAIGATAAALFLTVMEKTKPKPRVRFFRIYNKTRELERPVAPPGWTVCPDCRGAGSLFGAECATCDGKGGAVIPPKPDPGELLPQDPKAD